MENSPLIQVFTSSEVGGESVFPAFGVKNSGSQSAYLGAAIFSANSGGQPVQTRSFTMENEAIDADTGGSQSVLGAISFPYLYDVSLGQFIRAKSDTNGGDGIATANGNQCVLSFGATFDPVGGTWNRIRSIEVADAVTPSDVGNQVSTSFPFIFNDSTFDLRRSASASNVGNRSGIGVGLSVGAGEWTAVSTPAAATQATATRAASAAGERHVCRSITASITVDSTYAAGIATFLVHLRDGATGVGPILWSKRVQVTGDGAHDVELSGLNIVGSVNTAMTLEFSAAGAAGSFQSVALSGYSAG